MKCPKCGLINPDNALRCDCGYDFARKRMEKSYLAEAERNKQKGQPTERFNSGHTRALIVIVLMGILLLVTLAGVLLNIQQILLLSRIAAGEAITEFETDVSSLVYGLNAILQLLMLVATSIAFLFWVHRANKNLRAFGETNLRFTPGWAVGYWFVPIVSLWYPYKIVKEIWEWSVPQDRIQGREPSGASLIGWWWASFIIMGFSGQAASRAASSATTVDSLTLAQWFYLVYEIVMVISAILVIVIVRRIDRNQEESGRQVGLSISPAG